MPTDYTTCGYLFISVALAPADIWYDVVCDVHCVVDDVTVVDGTVDADADDGTADVPGNHVMVPLKEGECGTMKLDAGSLIVVVETTKHKKS